MSYHSLNITPHMPKRRITPSILLRVTTQQSYISFMKAKALNLNKICC
jgi:hypothetical protein